MTSRPRHNFIEWGFVVAMIGLCAALAALQYRWTGEVARAELARLHSSLAEQAQLLCRAFDAELVKSCTQLVPSGRQLEERGRDAAHVARPRQWAATKPRPIFSRVAVAVPATEGLQLFALDQKTGQLERMEWPAEWSDLRDNLSRKGPGPGGSSIYTDSSGALFEIPVRGGRPRGGPCDRRLPGESGGPREQSGPGGPGGPGGRGGPMESEWVIFELDLTYAREKWLPELVRTHLNLDGKPLYNVELADSTASRENAVAVRFNRHGRDADNSRAGGPADPFWILEAWRRPGAFEAVVAAARRRNLAVAVVLNGLILAAGLALLRHTRRSRALAEAQMNFVANVTHELRTPLTVIRGAAHNLERGVVHEPGKIAQYSGLIIQHAEQLAEMVEQVLGFAGAKKHLPASSRQPVALAEILRDSVAASVSDTQAACCEVELTIPPELPVVAGDATALRRVFQNLITNAAKHGGSGGWIGISAAVTNGSGPQKVEVQIADRGPGIPESEQPEIFQPFVRCAAAQAAQVRGSGLGLSLVREIVEAHGGGVSIRSESGRGATFTVRLPVHPQGAGAPPPRGETRGEGAPAP